MTIPSTSQDTLRIAPRRSLPLLIATLSMMGPFCIDTYLPSFHEMEHSLGATAAEVQQSLTAFLIPFAFMTLWHGALSDAWGRRKVVIVALSLVAIASVGCAFAPNVQVLWLFRVVQGLAAGVFVVGRAVVRDIYEGPAAQRVISQVAMLFTIAPAIAPVLGGQLHEWFGWRSVFIFLAGFAALIASWSGACLPETLPPERRHPLGISRLMNSYRATLTHHGFMLSSLAGAFNFTALFVYIAGAPAFLLGHLHVRETQFFWLFGPVTVGMMLGSALSGRVAGKLDTTHTLGWSYVAMIGAAAANVSLHLVRDASLPWSVIPLFVYAVGMSLSLPTLTLIGLDFFPMHRGLASSCQAFLLTAGNAIVAGLVVPFASKSPLKLALTSAALMFLGLVSTVWMRRTRRALAEVPNPA
jgi:DHA1 family bicyclomycin/chloramphenicol resistance-like MFS transporter